MYHPIRILALTEYHKEEELPVDYSTQVLSGNTDSVDDLVNTDSADDLVNTEVAGRELAVACTGVDTAEQVPACTGVDTVEQVPVCTGVGTVVVVAPADSLEGTVDKSLAVVDIL